MPPSSAPATMPSPAVLEDAVPIEPSWSEREIVNLLKRSIDDGNVDRKDLLRIMRESEKNAGTRHAEVLVSHAKILTALGAIDDIQEATLKNVVDAGKKPGTASVIAQWVNENPMLKQGLVSTILMLLGLIGTLATTYVTVRATGGWNSTPTPIVVAQPVAVQSAPVSAPAPSSDPAASQDAAQGNGGPPESLYHPGPTP